MQGGAFRGMRRFLLMFRFVFPELDSYDGENSAMEATE